MSLFAEFLCIIPGHYTNIKSYGKVISDSSTISPTFALWSDEHYLSLKWCTVDLKVGETVSTNEWNFVFMSGGYFLQTGFVPHFLRKLKLLVYSTALLVGYFCPASLSKLVQMRKSLLRLITPLQFFSMLSWADTHKTRQRHSGEDSYHNYWPVSFSRHPKPFNCTWS